MRHLAPPGGAGLTRALHRASAEGSHPAAVEANRGCPMSADAPVLASLELPRRVERAFRALA
ncbi:MAG TPA: hypothetical protein VGC83_18710, partial [Solirubrobacteraceae bacterium]